MSEPRKVVRLPIAPATVVKPTKCRCTPATCTCRTQKKVDKTTDPGKVNQ